MKSFRSQFTVQFSWSCSESIFGQLQRNLLFHIYAEVILNIGSVRGFKRKTMVTEQQSIELTWLVCNRKVWAPGTTDENSFLITSLTDAFSIRSQAFNGFESS